MEDEKERESRPMKYETRIITYGGDRDYLSIYDGGVSRHMDLLISPICGIFV